MDSVQQSERAAAAGPRGRLLATAARLIRERGVAGTGLTDLLKESRTARGSIYQHFPGGKDDLVAAAVRDAGEDSRQRVAALVALGDPAAVVEAIMAATRATLEQDDFARGCPVVAAAVSGPEYPSSVTAAGEVLTGWVRELGEVFVALGVAEQAATSLASLVVSAAEGALIQARATRATAPLDHAAEQLGELARRYIATG